MWKVLISACLLGEKVRYDGGDKRNDNAILTRWAEEGRLVPICPELAGGLGVPRPPAEIDGGNGEGVLDGAARVSTNEGGDVTAAFLAGAHAALDLARQTNAVLAILTEKSPSCGSELAYDGSFSGRTVPGHGVTTAVLRRAGIPVFSPDRLLEADAWLRAREAE